MSTHLLKICLDQATFDRYRNNHGIDVEIRGVLNAEGALAFEVSFWPQGTREEEILKALKGTQP